MLETKSQATEDFIAQYEAKEKDNLTMFDVPTTNLVYTLFRPAHGSIEQHFQKESEIYHITIQTPKNENVTSVLSGAVVYTTRSIEHEWVIVVQHENEYISIYKNNKRLLKKIGESVKAGESIAIASDEKPLWFELWQKGFPINPEEIISF